MPQNIKIGLKLWSTNNNYAKEAFLLHKKGIYNYIELYSVPDSFQKYLSIWKKINIPYIIHAPHFQSGMNLSNNKNKKTNLKLIKESLCWAEELNARYIIFHPGIGGNYKETIRQLNTFKNKKILIENKPYYGIGQKGICTGNSPEEIKFIIEKTQVGFCLDIAHAIYSSNVKKIKYTKYLRQFLKLNPVMFHLTDGNCKGILDSHLHLGTGNFNLKNIIDILPENAILTIETPKTHKNRLIDFEEDVLYLKKLLFKTN